jgi:hypothetical protein
MWFLTYYGRVMRRHVKGWNLPKSTIQPSAQGSQRFRSSSAPRIHETDEAGFDGRKGEAFPQMREGIQSGWG